MLESSIKSHLDTIAPQRSHALKLPNKPKYPALVYTPVSENRRILIDGGGAYKTEARIQVDAWAKTYSSAKTLANTLRSGLDGFAGDLQGTTIGLIRVDGGRDDFDNDAGLFRVSTDLMIHY